MLKLTQGGGGCNDEGCPHPVRSVSRTLSFRTASSVRNLLLLKRTANSSPSARNEIKISLICSSCRRQLNFQPLRMPQNGQDCLPPGLFFGQQTMQVINSRDSVTV